MRNTLCDMLRQQQANRLSVEAQLPNSRRVDIVVDGYSRNYREPFTCLFECKLLLNGPNIERARVQLLSYSRFYPGAFLVIAGMSAKHRGKGSQAQRNAAVEIKETERCGIEVWQLDQYQPFCEWVCGQMQGQGLEQLATPYVNHSQMRDGYVVGLSLS